MGFQMIFPLLATVRFSLLPIFNFVLWGWEYDAVGLLRHVLFNVTFKQARL
jgi:hypothetical protein